MSRHILPSEKIALLAHLPNETVSAGATATINWVRPRDLKQIMFILNVGTMVSGSEITVTVQTASSGAGADATDTTLTRVIDDTGGDTQYVFDFYKDAFLDVIDNQEWLGLEVAVANQDSDVAYSVLGLEPYDYPASEFNHANVVLNGQGQL